ncbi:MAG: DUF4845 domain-containing protein [Dokdonella sp.]
MKMHRKIKGITLIGFAMVMCVLGFFAYMAMRLIPMYTEYFGVVKAMEQVRHEPGASTKSLEEIRRGMSIKFDTQYVDEADVPMSAIMLKREGGTSILRIAYEKRVPFVYNLELVGKFDKSMSLTNAGAE